MITQKNKSVKGVVIDVYGTGWCVVQVVIGLDNGHTTTIMMSEKQAPAKNTRGTLRYTDKGAAVWAPKKEERK